MADLVPTLKVEIAFATANVYDTAPTWTDVTAYVLQNPPLQINRGRPNELGTFIPGRCTFTLNNNDGRFSPLNASSPYAGQLLPRRQVRVTATWAATDYVIFRGYVMGWPQTYAPGKVAAYVPLECYDLFAILNETDLSDFYYEYQRTGIGSLRMAYMDVVGRGIADRQGNQDLRYRSTTVATTSALAPGLTDSAALLFGGGVSATGADDTTASSFTTYTISFWFRTTLTDGVLISGGSGTTALTISLTGGFLGITSRADNVFSLSNSYADGMPHHAVFIRDFGGGTLKVYVDGVDDTGGPTIVPASPSSPYVDTLGGQGGGTLFFNGTLQAVSVFTKALSASEIKNLYRIGVGIFGDDTSTRMGRLLDAAGVPSSWRSLTTEPYGMVSGGWSGGAALSLMQAVAATEQGAFYVGRTGNVTLLSRYWQQQSGSAGASIQATFSDDGSDGQYVDTGFDYDDLQVRNAIIVSGVDGTATATDATSVAKYGRQELSVSTQLGTYGECLTMAQGILADLKDPKIRTRPLTLDLRGNTAQWPTVLALDLGHRVRFEITPPGVGSQYQTSQLIQQLDYSITQFEWDVTVQGSPLPVAAGIYDTDTYDGTAVYGY